MAAGVELDDAKAPFQPKPFCNYFVRSKAGGGKDTSTPYRRVHKVWEFFSLNLL